MSQNLDIFKGKIDWSEINQFRLIFKSFTETSGMFQ